MAGDSADLVFRSARELQGLLRRGELSARELVQVQLDRIEQVNPAVNAVVSLRAEEALAEAHAADELHAAGAELGQLHGLPLAHKDTHATAGIRTTSGSPLFAEHVPEQDELLVERLRGAGTITLGKTNVPEFAAGSHTFNPIFGTTHNPYDTSRSAGGSSGGAAAALAAGLQPLADGSDMGGSLRNPASFTNVVGLRPSPGRVPSWPTPLAWSTLSVQGPMARSVADVALMLSVLAGPDARSPLAVSTPADEFAAPLTGDVRGLRVAWSPDLDGRFTTQRAVSEVLTGQLGVFEELGCTVTEAAPNLDGAEEAFRTLRAWTMASTLGPLLDAAPDQIKPSLAWNINAGRKLDGADVATAEHRHTEVFHRMREFFTTYDALLLPVSQVVPFPVEQEYPTEIDGVPQNTYLDWMRSSYLISITGCPALSVPAGFSPDGLPVGLQIVGPHLAERRVLELGHAFEQATGFGRRRPPLVE